MAETAEGRFITDAHRIAQVQVGADTALESRALWPMLDPSDLSRSAPGWIAATSLAVNNRHRQSGEMATTYLRDFRQAEIGTTDGPVIQPRLNLSALTGVLITKGPASIRQDLATGVPVEVAVQRAEAATSAWASQFAMAGGRDTVDRSSRADRRARRRYRRVSDGDPCAFCAMLVTRGYRYSEEAAFFRSHPHCGCTAEPGYGRWEPDDIESKWLDSYVEAAKEAKQVDGAITEETVLWRMRRNSPDLFSDGVHH